MTYKFPEHEELMVTAYGNKHTPIAFITRHQFTLMQHLYRVRNGKITKTKHESMEPTDFDKLIQKWSEEG